MTKISAQVIVNLFLFQAMMTNCSDSLNQRLIDAAKQDDVLKIQKLLKEGAGINAQDKNGCTALYFASDQDHVAVVNVLLAAGADVNAQSKRGYTALHAASYKGHAAAVSALLAAGADVNAQNENGYTALYAASCYGHIAAVSALLAAGANINIQDRIRYTALHRASCHGHVAVARVLLVAGATVNIQDGNKATALDYATLAGRLDLVRVLLAHGAEIDIMKIPNDINDSIQQELRLYETFQKNPTLKNTLYKKAYQEYRKGIPVWLHLLLGLDNRMQEDVAESQNLKNQVKITRNFFKHFLEDHFFNQLLLEMRERDIRNDLEAMSDQAFKKIEEKKSISLKTPKYRSNRCCEMQ